MNRTILATAAVALALPAARATDTMTLGGVGSLSNPAATAPVMNLKLDETTAAETIDVHYPIARGLAWGAWGAARVASYPFRPWGGYGWYRPWGGYRPWFGYGGYRPWGWYRPWLGYYRPWGGWGGYGGWYGSGVTVSVGGYPGYYAGYSPVYSSVYYSYPAVSAYGCECVASAPQAAAPRAGEMGPVPAPAGGYRYDGGPAPLPPAPAPAPVPKAVTPPRPAAPPASTPPPPTAASFARRPVKQFEYPAYGESPEKVRKANSDPLLVKDSRGR